ncbi:ABC transporter substrate-binding protein [Cohnella terricola]|uniref:Extracellular solute-binding protein n=1 Tax=Cohnella terricola TaxID=1289167 RepID=A0A559JN15_9BACL|nr:extracellular solute-binding protein [Cohnella terricola]TVY01274.1 extracellular solute-binding protein [Cohnella terricola]
MFKKIAVSSLSVAMLAGVLAGCGGSGEGKENSSSGTSGSNEGKVKIRILTRLASEQPNAVAFQDKVKEFQELNPNIVIEDLSVEDGDTFNTKFKTSVASGNLPEIFANYGGAAFAEYAKSGVAMDLTEVLEGDKQWSEPFLDVFDNWRFQDVPGTYAVPYEFFAIGVFYNKDLFSQANIQVPTTIGEFEEAMQKLKDAGIVPMALGEKDSWRGGHLYSVLANKLMGDQVADDILNRKIKYDDQRFIDVLELMKSWQKKGFFGDNIVSLDTTAEKNMFHTEKTAMHMDGSWYIGEAIKSPIGDKIGFFPFPYSEDKPEYKDVWMGGAGMAFSISGTLEGEKKEAAIKFLKFVTSEDAFKYYQEVQQGGVFPVKMEVDPTKVDPLSVSYSEAIKNATFRSELYAYDPLPQMFDTVRNNIQGMFAGMAPDKAAKSMQDQVDKLLK